MYGGRIVDDASARASASGRDARPLHDGRGASRRGAAGVTTTDVAPAASRKRCCRRSSRCSIAAGRRRPAHPHRSGSRPAPCIGCCSRARGGTRTGSARCSTRRRRSTFTGLAVALGAARGLVQHRRGEPARRGRIRGGAASASLLPAGTPGAARCFRCASSPPALGGGIVGGVPGVLKARFGAHEVIVDDHAELHRARAAELSDRRVHFQVSETLHTRGDRQRRAAASLGLRSRRSTARRRTRCSCSRSLAVAAAWVVPVPHARGLRAARGRSAAGRGGVRRRERRRRVVANAGARPARIAGLGGLNYVLGYKHYYEEGFGAGAGFLGIAVALVGRNHPVGVVLAAVLFATLSQGGLAVNALVPKQMVDVLQAVVIIAVATAVPEVRRALMALRGRLEAGSAERPPRALTRPLARRRRHPSASLPRHASALAFLAQTLRIAMPYLFAAAGGVISERAGLIALTLEGYMLTGAFRAAVGSYYAGPVGRAACRSRRWRRDRAALWRLHDPLSRQSGRGRHRDQSARDRPDALLPPPRFRQLVEFAARRRVQAETGTGFAALRAEPARVARRPRAARRWLAPVPHAVRSARARGRRASGGRGVGRRARPAHAMVSPSLSPARWPASAARISRSTSTSSRTA